MIWAEMWGSNACQKVSMTCAGYSQDMALTLYAYGRGGSVYWGVDMAPNSNGCCSAANIPGTIEMRVDRQSDKLN